MSLGKKENLSGSYIKISVNDFMDFRRELEGKLLTLVDASHEDAVQRKALKDLFSQLLWEWVHRIKGFAVPPNNNESS